MCNNDLQHEAYDQNLDAFDARLARFHRAQEQRARFYRWASTQGSHQVPIKVQKALSTCGNLLNFRHYVMSDEMSLVGGCFCDQYKVCQLCALMRGGRMLRILEGKTIRHIQEHPDYAPYLVTVTLKNAPDLRQQFTRLREALKIQTNRSNNRRNHGKGKRTELEKAIGHFRTIEIKRGGGGHGWHPHCHAVWFCNTPPDQSALSKEWQEITGDSYIVDVRPLNYNDEDSLRKSLCEVCAYVMKLSDAEPADAWEVHTITKRKHLRQSFGTMRFTAAEMQEIEESTKPKREDEPYIDYLYRWYSGEGYRMVSESPVCDPATHQSIQDQHAAELALLFR